MPAPPPCDTHVHVFDPARFALAPIRRFTPGAATVAQMQVVLQAAGMARVVLVQPSVYGHDHACLLDALQRLGPMARGVAVPDPQATPLQLAALDAAGVAGARLNAVVHQWPGQLVAADALLQALQGMESRLPGHWHVQLHVSLASLVGPLAPHLVRSDRVYVVDHLGLPTVAHGIAHPLWQGLLHLLDTGRVFLKLSGPYLSSALASPYADLEPLVRSLAPWASQLLWGSNWPHTRGVHRPADGDPLAPEAFRTEDPCAWHHQCQTWLGADGPRLHHNAARVYGF